MPADLILPNAGIGRDGVAPGVRSPLIFPDHSRSRTQSKEISHDKRICRN